MQRESEESSHRRRGEAEFQKWLLMHVVHTPKHGGTHLLPKLANSHTNAGTPPPNLKILSPLLPHPHQHQQQLLPPNPCNFTQTTQPTLPHTPISVSTSVRFYPCLLPVFFLKMNLDTERNGRNLRCNTTPSAIARSLTRKLRRSGSKMVVLSRGKGVQMWREMQGNKRERMEKFQNLR